MECPRLPDKTGPVMTNKTFESVGSLLLFQALVLGGGITIGIVTAPGDWYAALVKPPYNPPNWIFAPVWTTLYILIAVAGWRIWKRGQDSWSMKIWWAQLVMNFIWSPIFFFGSPDRFRTGSDHIALGYDHRLHHRELATGQNDFNPFLALRCMGWLCIRPERCAAALKRLIRLLKQTAQGYT